MNIEEAIVEQEERLRLAQLKSDVNELSILLDDRLIFSAWDGSIIGKEDDLSLHKSPEFRIIKMDVLERKIECFDSTAIVNVLMDASATVGTDTQAGKMRYIRVWHRFSDGWRVVSGFMRTE